MARFPQRWRTAPHRHHPLDDELRRDAVLRCLRSGDWRVLHEAELKGLMYHLERTDQTELPVYWLAVRALDSGEPMHDRG